MRGIDIFCASQAATAIRPSMDQASSSSSSSSSSAHLGTTPAIDRHNPIIRDAKRLGRALPLGPCTSQPPPIAPVPYNLLHQKSRKSSSKSNDQSKKRSSKKKTAGVKLGQNETQRKSSVKAGDLITPPGSSRYLLGDKAFLDVLSDFDPVLSLVSVDDSKSKPVKLDYGPSDSSASDSKPPSSRSPDQVVVLRVSLHCRGCEGKLRKHLSRMQGLTSFDIDFAAKKVTVVGDVTPLSVLASISKVKNAQLLTPGVVSSLPGAGSEMKKSIGVGI